MKTKTIVATLLGLVLAIGLISLGAPAASAKQDDKGYCKEPNPGQFVWSNGDRGNDPWVVGGETKESCLALNNPKPTPSPTAEPTTPAPTPTETTTPDPDPTTEQPTPEPTKTEQPTPTPTETSPEPEPTKTEEPAPSPTDTTPEPEPTLPVEEPVIEEPVTEQPSETPAPPADEDGDEFTDVCVEQGLSFDYTTGECFEDWSEQVDKRTEAVQKSSLKAAPKGAKKPPTKTADVTTMDSLPRTGPSENALIAGLAGLLIASGAGLMRLARVKG